MADPLAQYLTQRFYDWEVRGRGWCSYDESVTPEPPFIPFYGHFVDQYVTPADDGRRETLLSQLAKRALALFKTKQSEPEPESIPEIKEKVRFDRVRGLSHISIVLPQEITYPKDITEQFLLNLSQCQYPVCLELVGRSGAVSVHLTVDVSDEIQATTVLQSHFPDAIITPEDDPILKYWQDEVPTGVFNFGLADEFMLPLRCYRSFAPDPLTGLIATLGMLQTGEMAAFQIRFEPTRYPWAESIRRSVLLPSGKPFFTNAPDFAKQALSKISSPLYGVNIRAITQAADIDQVCGIIQRISASLSTLDNPQGNSLNLLHNSKSDVDELPIDVITRCSKLSGMILSLDELLSLVHLPGATIATPTLVRSAIKTKPAPEIACKGSLILGENIHAGKVKTVGQTREQRVRHTYLIGASGSGKSTLLSSMIKQDIEQGNGFGVLDPHGDLIDVVLSHVPPERFDDVVLLDLADEEYPIPFNILSAHTELEKNLLASDLAASFERLASSWGDVMTAVLSNAILAFLESDKGGTLADLRRFLVEKQFRAKFLSTVRDPEVAYYWQHEFPLVSGKPQGSIVTRLNTFLRPKPIRYMVSHGENHLDVSDMMNTGKIFLARIPQGAIGEENAFLLGTLLVSAFHRSALSRQSVDATQRKPFYLYIDEFHHFVTPSMAQILSGARKYGLGLILAHQELRQLESRNSDVASAVISNPATRICFNLGDQDAKRLESGFASFTASDLQNLSVGNAICRMERSEFDFNLRVPLPPKVNSDDAKMRETEIRKRSRKRYAVQRSDVEKILEQYRADMPVAKRKHPKPKVVQDIPLEKPQEQAPEVEPVTKTETIQKPASTPGRGGQKHKSIQRLIKHWAEGMGYRAQIEKPILEGRGAVDVALYKGDISIACEISITTPTDHECANLIKCLDAKFDHVAMIADEEERLEKVRKKSKTTLENTTYQQVHFMLPQQLFRFIEELEQSAVNSSTTVRGYRVKINRSPLDANERSERMKSIKRTIAGAAIRRGSRGNKDES